MSDNDVDTQKNEASAVFSENAYEHNDGYYNAPENFHSHCNSNGEFDETVNEESDDDEEETDSIDEGNTSRCLIS